MKFTPGPWEVKYETNVVDKNGRSVATCGGYGSNVDTEKVYYENIANAHLISHTVAMYKVLKQVERLLDSGKEVFNKANGDTELVLFPGNQWVNVWSKLKDILKSVEDDYEQKICNTL